MSSAINTKDVDPETPLSRRYTRSIKALVRVGEASSSGIHDKTIGQQLEIRLLQAPHTLELGAPITIHVQFESSDLPAQLVRAFVKENDGTVTVQKNRTDEAGHAEFVLDRPGFWLVRIAHLRQCDECDTDWDTYYGIYSFVYP